MTYIHSVKKAFPKYHYKQDEILGFLKELWFENPDFTENRYSKIESIFKNVCVDERYLSLPLEEYANLTGPETKNQAWLESACDISTRACTELIESSGIDIDSIGMIMSTTVTGLAIPSLEARLMNKVPLKKETKRIPLFGLGCLAGVAGINRAHDYLKGHPKEAVLFFSVELCSLTVQVHDFDMANSVSTALFGDGGAAVLLLGEEHPLRNEAKMKVIGSQSNFYPNTERTMGWDITDKGFKVVLSGDVPKVASEFIPNDLNNFLSRVKLNREDLNFYVAHPGGPKVLEALEESLDLSKQDLKYSWEGLSKYGNLSSTSVLISLEQTLTNLPPKDSHGLMLSMGPAFCSEMSLIKCLI